MRERKFLRHNLEGVCKHIAHSVVLPGPETKEGISQTYSHKRTYSMCPERERLYENSKTEIALATTSTEKSQRCYSFFLLAYRHLLQSTSSSACYIQCMLYTGLTYE